jgi:biopolymer transport protein ExbD
MTLAVKLDGAGQISLDGKPAADLQELESWLAAALLHDPQTAVRLHTGGSNNYDVIGKVIYLVHRLGIMEGSFSVDGS